jgi:hypothetical protein
MSDELITNLDRPVAEVAIGPSMLEHLATDSRLLDTPTRFVVPVELVRLSAIVAEGSAEHQRFLAGIIGYFRQSPWRRRRLEGDDDLVVAARLADVIVQLDRQGRLLTLGDEAIEPDIAEALGDLYLAPRFQVALSPRRPFLRDYLIKVYSWSKATGGFVVEATRRPFSDLGHFIVTLQIPDKADAAIRLKRQPMKRLFGFRGGSAVQFFVGLALHVGGLIYPIVGVAGTVIIVADP